MANPILPGGSRLRGAVLGGLLGLTIFAIWSTLMVPSEPVAAVVVEPSRGTAQVLGDVGGKDPGVLEKVNARTMSLLYVIQARLRSDDFASALTLVNEAHTPEDRDYLLVNVGDRTLRAFDPNTGTAKTYIEEEGGPVQVANALPRLRKVVDAFHDASLKVRYLVRLETAQFLLNRIGPEGAPPGTASPRPVPVEPMLDEATKLARSIRAEVEVPVGKGFHLPWDRGILLTGLLSVAGFFASALAEPLVNSYGSRLATVVEHRLKGTSHEAVATASGPGLASSPTSHSVQS